MPEEVINPNVTDFYQQCEDGFAREMKKLTSFFKKDYQVADDDTVLAEGGDYFVVYRPGSFPMTGKSAEEKDVTWGIVFDLYVRYESYKASWKNFRVARSAIINRFVPNPTLGGTPGVWNVGISSGENAQYFSLEEKAVRPNFIIQTMRCDVTQRCKFEQFYPRLP